jgi:hypothetical protein
MQKLEKKYTEIGKHMQKLEEICRPRKHRALFLNL